MTDNQFGQIITILHQHTGILNQHTQKLDQHTASLAQQDKKISILQETVAKLEQYHEMTIAYIRQLFGHINDIRVKLDVDNMVREHRVPHDLISPK